MDSHHFKMNLPPTPKHQLRMKIKQQRDLLTTEEIEAGSLTITDRVMRVIRAHDFQSVMIYFHFGSEVMTDYLLKELIHDGRTVLGPVTFPRKRLEAYRIVDPKTDLVVGDFGILTPNVKHCQRVSPESVDCVVVPGIAFDRHGWRIGYGAGYYDRFMARCTQAHRIGVAFALQIVDQTFPDPWDIPVKQIATDQELINC